jgi:hypothetical protein
MSQRVVAVLLTGLLLFVQTSCTVRKVEKLDVATVSQPEREEIVGVTTKKGEDVSFDQPGGSLKEGVIYAQVNKSWYTVPLSDVQRLWVTREGISAARTIGLTAAIVVGTLVTIVAVALATKQSCPFVYSWDGTRYVFDAEPYGGAIAHGLERDDYSQLDHLREQNGAYRLLLTNEVDETQFTNLMELWVVDHPRGTRVLADEYGKLYGLTEVQPLTDARDAQGNDLRHWLQATDRLIWEPDAAPGPDGSLRQEVVLTFPKPEGATQAKLVANVGTGLWGSYMIKKMIELRGREAGTWLASLDRNPTDVEAVHAWVTREEIYRLQFYVEEPTGWELRGSLLGSGPLLVKDRVVPLDVSHVRGNQLRIRLRPPVGFWALNSFAISYAPDRPLNFQRVAPVTARTAEGRNLLPELLESDDRYYIMPDNADRAEITFPAPPRKAGLDRTVFLHSRGWYQLHLAPGGDPDMKKLQEITEVHDGAVRYAVDEYTRWRAGKR